MEDQPLGILVVVVVAQALLVLVEMFQQETAVMAVKDRLLRCLTVAPVPVVLLQQVIFLEVVVQAAMEHPLRAELEGLVVGELALTEQAL
jgi:hypothetical protein